MVPRLDAKSKKMVSVDENLYPRKSINEDTKIKIDSYMSYVETMVNRNQSRFTKLVIQYLIMKKSGGKNPQEAQLKADIDEELRVFRELILSNLEK